MTSTPTSQPNSAPTSAPGSEYQTRLWMGLVMGLAAIGLLVGDYLLETQYGWRLYPCLFLSVLVLAYLLVLELHGLLAPFPRPPLWLCLSGTVIVAGSAWPSYLGLFGSPPNPFRDLALLFAGLVLVGFLWEMAIYRQPDQALVRMSLFVWTIAYMGFLPSFLAHLRWSEGNNPLHGVAAFSLSIFVPKGCDIGAYFTGRLLGRNRMTPLLSPKKTWEGLLGGLGLSAVIALSIHYLVAPLFSGWLEATLFGVVLGGVGVLGDLAESLIKRECRQKDASHVVPGFGGVMDVLDSVLFAAPVAYCWLRVAG